MSALKNIYTHFAFSLILPFFFVVSIFWRFDYLSIEYSPLIGLLSYAGFWFLYKKVNFTRR